VLYGGECRPAPHRADACRVLILDEETPARARLAVALHAADYEVVVAETSAQALALLDSMPCDIVVSDWHMADREDLALCRQLRLRSRGHDIFILMLSARRARMDGGLGLAAGADAYLPQGAAIEEILGRLEGARRIVRRNGCSVRHRGVPRSTPMIDPLTGAYSGSYLEEHLPRELARSQRSGHVLAVLICHVEDQRHPAMPGGHGSLADPLRTFATLARSLIRRGDWLARTGMESFMIVLPETSCAGAHCVARKLRAGMALEARLGRMPTADFAMKIDATTIDGNRDADGWDRLAALLHFASSDRRSRHAGALA
jgi:diguanylate cyclase (GGDEF)-like protein